MKIGIITFQNAHNFGACMQLYALQQYLIGLGHHVTVVNYLQPAIENSYQIIPKKSHKRLISKIFWILQYFLILLKKPYLKKRRRKFKNFSKKYFKLSQPCSSLSELCEVNFDFDALIMGSDQIWNSGITGKIDYSYFGDFVTNDVVRISYAASIGNDIIPDDMKDVFRLLLRKVDYISVREKTAKHEITGLTDKKVSKVIDPTFLVDRNVFDIFPADKKFKKEYIYVHVHHYTAKSKKLIEVAEIASKNMRIPIIHNIQGVKFSNQLGTTYCDDPGETIGVIKNAKLVISQSFHITAFSIIFNKVFLVVPRAKYNSRISNLLHELELEYLLLSNMDILSNIEDIHIDYESVQTRINELKEKSCDFLYNALCGSKIISKDWFESKDAFSCYSCSACKDICPVGAIRMYSDEEGFVHPIIDENKCIKCNKCRDYCIYNTTFNNKPFESKAFICWQNDYYERINSSSGGLFGALSSYVIDNDGYVIGVRYKDDLSVIYDITTTKEGCFAFKYSKYVEPDHNDIYKKTLDALKLGKLVLFSGLPCKIAGLKNFLGKEWSNLYLVELICHCSASPIIFKKYIETKELRQKAPIRSIKFHDKSVSGWGQTKLATTIIFEDGSKESFVNRKNLYINSFINGFLAKKSCYECKFTGDNKIADLTIGDFWGAERFIDESLLKDGCSSIKINTEKGLILFNEISSSLFTKEVTVEDMYNSNHNRPVMINMSRNFIFKNILEEGNDVLKILKQAKKNK